MANITDAVNTDQQLPSCLVVATSNQSGTFSNGPTNSGVGATFTYATGALTIDGVTTQVGDLILFSAQTNGYENGIWEVITAGDTGVAAVLQRAAFLQCVEQMSLGSFTFISKGTTYKGSVWTMTTSLPAAMGIPTTSGENDIIFTQGPNLTNLGLHSSKYTNAGGSATTSITDASITTSSVVVGAWQSSTNAVSVQKITPGSGSITVLSSGDPGSSVFAYIATNTQV